MADLVILLAIGIISFGGSLVISFLCMKGQDNGKDDYAPPPVYTRKRDRKRAHKRLRLQAQARL